MVGAACNPLAVTYPSPLTLVQYPLLATNVRLLCEQDGWRVRKQSSLTSTFIALRLTYRTEGLAGLYRGLTLYVLHQLVRDGLRFTANLWLGASLSSWGQLSLRSGHASKGSESGEVSQGFVAESASAPEPCGEAVARHMYWWKLAAKYLIDAACYPLLLASTRAVLLREDGCSAWSRLCTWCQVEGALSLFGGLTASLVSSALDEAADALLEVCIDRCSAGSAIGSVDRLMLKACSCSLASVFTAPFNYVGVIQRCQSPRLPGLPRPAPLWGTVLNLPWQSSIYQLVMFGGILALNVKMIQLKLELDDGPQEDNDE
eukprot:CAMPEP_0171106562 /NCGR_PEP_ID=MMETSP0766_2-20121228/65019_1 /TAXON_ID=439317 /ORGANISM="Gambierdiscus australes, Strain CAWD 149" /LENGTH=316 /DNA_ID=CAMNT_0011567675 /DNA_START=138 /DNA_END=1088 /DNA_ORIENTATION=+